MTTRSLVATLGPRHDKPWWWRHLALDPRQCTLEYERLVYRNRYPRQIPTIELPFVMLKVLFRLLRWRRKYVHVFTVEFDWTGLSIAFWQTVTGMRRPRHVIVQFIMREEQPTLRSRAKYALMRILFQSVDRVVVSSVPERDYYRDAFGWPEQKIVFVPVFTDPELLARPATDDEDDYYLAAGRTFRDYDTLMRAVRGTNLKVLVVGGGGTVRKFEGLGNVRAMEDIPIADLETLMRRSRGVVVPLQDRAISIGQSVLLQAMALGKAVVATRTAGTVDYIDDRHDGLLVQAGNDVELRDALQMLEDADVRRRLGARARERIAAMHLPRHYASGIGAALAV